MVRPYQLMPLTFKRPLWVSFCFPKDSLKNLYKNENYYIFSTVLKTFFYLVLLKISQKNYTMKYLYTIKKIYDIIFKHTTHNMKHITSLFKLNVTYYVLHAKCQKIN